MRLRKLISELIESNKQLSKQTSDLAKALGVDKIKKYDELKSNVDKLPHLAVKNTRMVIDEKSGRIGMEIIYDHPKTTIWFNDDDKVVVPDSFKAINSLNLLSVKECEKIRKGMEDVKNESLR